MAIYHKGRRLDGGGGGISQEEADARYLKKTGGELGNEEPFVIHANSYAVGILEDSSIVMTSSSAGLYTNIEDTEQGEKNHLAAVETSIFDDGKPYASLSAGTIDDSDHSQINVYEQGISMESSHNMDEYRSGIEIRPDHIALNVPGYDGYKSYLEFSRDGLLLDGSPVLTEEQADNKIQDAIDGIMTPYDYAVEGGYTGTPEEFQAALGSAPWLPLSGGDLAGGLGLVFKGKGSQTLDFAQLLTGSKGGKIREKIFSISPEVGIPRTKGDPVFGFSEVIDQNGESFDFLPHNFLGISGGMGIKGNVSLNGNHLYYIADPTYSDEAANKGYVDRKIKDSTVQFWGEDTSIEHVAFTSGSASCSIGGFPYLQSIGNFTIGAVELDLENITVDSYGRLSGTIFFDSIAPGGANTYRTMGFCFIKHSRGSDFSALVSDGQLGYNFTFLLPADMSDAYLYAFVFGAYL